MYSWQIEVLSSRYWHQGTLEASIGHTMLFFIFCNDNYVSSMEFDKLMGHLVPNKLFLPNPMVYLEKRNSLPINLFYVWWSLHNVFQKFKLHSIDRVLFVCVCLECMCITDTFLYFCYSLSCKSSSVYIPHVIMIFNLSLIL